MAGKAKTPPNGQKAKPGKKTSPKPAPTSKAEPSSKPRTRRRKTLPHELTNEELTAKLEEMEKAVRRGEKDQSLMKQEMDETQTLVGQCIAFLADNTKRLKTVEQNASAATSRFKAMDDEEKKQKEESEKSAAERQKQYEAALKQRAKEEEARKAQRKKEEAAEDAALQAAYEKKAEKLRKMKEDLDKLREGDAPPAAAAAPDASLNGKPHLTAAQQPAQV